MVGEPATRTLYGLLVGIDRYRPPIPPLGGCVNDVEAVATLLSDFAAGGEFRPELKLLRDAEATRAAVVEGFRQHLRQAGSNDVALFYFSGHGSQEDTPPEFWHLEPDRLDETLVCYDSRNPDQWDLADKELAALVAEVAGRGAHVVCVLDCCHSGSGTRAALDEGTAVRRAPTDRRRRPLEAFLDGALASSPGRDEASSSTGWAVVPRGRHVLLAACQASETAKEVREDGRQHGAFSAGLLAALRQTRGLITYRDLVKRAEAQVRLRVAQQIPQLEAHDPDDTQQPFLGGAVRRQHAHLTLRHDRLLGWVIDGGAVHGIAGASSGETTTLAIFDADAAPEAWRRPDGALATAEVEEVRPELSRVAVATRGDGALDPSRSYRAIVTGTPLPALGVFLVGDDVALALVRQALATAGDQGQRSLLVREVADQSEAALRVDASDRAYRISRALSDRPLVSEIEGISAEAARLAAERLEHVARWEAIARLANPESHLGDAPIEVVIWQRRRDAAGNWAWEELDPRRSIRLEYVHADGKWQQPRLRIELRNRGATDLYCALLWLGEDYLVDGTTLVPAGVEHIPAGASFAVHGGRDIYASVPKEKWAKGRTEVHDVLKLLVSTAPFDARLFEQEKLDLYVRTRAAGILPGRPRSVFERLAARVHFRSLSTMPEDEELGDWAASELALTVVRPLEAEEVPPPGEARELGAGVALLGHPALRAKARLVSPTEAARGLDGVSLPAVLRDDPDASQPFVFEAARGADPGLSALQLVDVENPDAVTLHAPLRLRLAGQRLAPGEHVLAFAWDGEFFLPLGATRDTEHGTEIELRQLPAPRDVAGDAERGILSSVRILFQKVASSYLGIGFDYPRLSAVEFRVEGEPTYETSADAVRERVAGARRVLLHVHGILGDTLGMVSSSRAEVALLGATPQRIADLYDLILTFDYENINTGIEATARGLKERLAAVGLGPDHGKTLHIVAHSMGGLVARWFIEREGGGRVVQYLVTLGTPHAGSPWPTLQGWATAGLALALNGLSQVAWPAKLLGDLVAAVEAVDVTLDQMAPDSNFLADLARSTDPKMPYTLLVGNTSVIPTALEDGKVAGLLARLSPQRVLHAATTLAFLRAPNDVAVGVVSAKAVPEGREPPPRVEELGCDHLTFFSSDAGRQALLAAMQRA